MMMGAQMPESWLEKFMIPPTFPTLLLGAISEGTDQPTGDAADSPPMEMLIQISAVIALCVFAAPRIPKPHVVPATIIVFRTLLASHPRSMSRSTSQPPMTRSATVATSHGTPV